MNETTEDSEDSDILSIDDSSNESNEFGSDEATSEAPTPKMSLKMANKSKRNRKNVRTVNPKRSKKKPKNNRTVRTPRLLLNDALKDTDTMEGWSNARKKAWKSEGSNPNAFYYRFNKHGEEGRNGDWSDSEHQAFMERVMECGVNVKWGIFSSVIPGRIGYVCSNYWRTLIKDGWVKDPNYWVCYDGSTKFKYLQRGSMPEDIRRYSFVVLKDPSGTFAVPGYHPNRPSNQQLTKCLQDDVKQLTEVQMRGKRGRTKTLGKVSKRGAKNGRIWRKRKRTTMDEEDQETDSDIQSTSTSTKPKSKKRKVSRRNKKRRFRNEEDTISTDNRPRKRQRRERSKSEDTECSKDIDGGNRRRKRRKESNGMDESQRRETNGNDADDEQSHTDIVETDWMTRILHGEDMMTGEPMVKPAISPYGHVMEYDSWCRVLRDATTKNRCPFTQKILTRRQLVKLDEDNIREFKDKIRNFTEREKASVTITPPEESADTDCSGVITCRCGNARCQEVMGVISSAVQRRETGAQEFDCKILMDSLKRIL